VRSGPAGSSGWMTMGSKLYVMMAMRSSLACWAWRRGRPWAGARPGRAAAERVAAAPTRKSLRFMTGSSRGGVERRWKGGARREAGRPAASGERAKLDLADVHLRALGLDDDLALRRVGAGEPEHDLAVEHVDRL